MSIRHLDRLFEPRSVAVIGASVRPGSVGGTVWRNLRNGGFKGTRFAVNPKYRAIDGEPCHANVASLPETPDLAVICTPAATVVPLIGELGKAGVRAAIVTTAGLSPAQKQAMLDAARPHVLRVLGPNCVGLLNPHVALNASFSHVGARAAGPLAFVSQSGALVTAVLDWTQSRGIGLSCLVSLGEHADVDFGDVLDHLASDPHTRAILLYAESITSAQKFMSAARAAARNKPVIILKAGRSQHGAQAAVSHTGALAGADIVYDAAIRRAGMLRVDTLRDLFMAAETLARFNGSDDAGLTIVTNGGGAGVLAADAADASGVPLPALSSTTQASLDRLLPATWSHGNPVDLIGDAPVERYTGALCALLADRTAGTLLFMHAPTAIVPPDEIAEACLPLLQPARHRVMASWLGGESVARARNLFSHAGIAVYDTPEDAVHAYALLRAYRQNQALLEETPAAGELPAPDLPLAQRHVQDALASGASMLDAQQAAEVLQAYGIPVLPTRISAPLPEAAAALAGEIGFPVAIKIQSRQLTHKSDAGGVQLDLPDAPAVCQAAQRMLQAVSERRPDAQVDGFIVQAMAQRPQATELILGASVDAVFGPVILFGRGGVEVEVVADRAVALPPLNQVLARDLVSRTDVSRLLGGYRGRPPAKLDAVYDVLIRLSRLMADLPEVVELDINPLCADTEGVLALDARIRVEPAAAGGASRFAIQPYPGELVRSIAWQGETLTLRPIRPEDAKAHREFVSLLSPEDLRLRFFGMRRVLPASELARLVQIDYAREMAFVLMREHHGGEPELLGVARSVCDPDNEDAEFAIVVRSDLKRRGLGRILLTAVLDHLRAHGTRRVIGEVLNENSPMRSLMQALGFSALAPASRGESRRYGLELRRG